jgi:hypothetical protein
MDPRDVMKLIDMATIALVSQAHRNANTHRLCHC